MINLARFAYLSNGLYVPLLCLRYLFLVAKILDK